MIEYRMMDDECLLTSCLPAGPVPLQKTQRSSEEPSWAESKFRLETGTIARFLKACNKAYGSCAVLALDGGNIVGKLRFYPAKAEEALHGNACVQTEESVRRIAAFDPASLPAKETLRPKALCIGCIQVVSDSKNTPDYRGRGIATAMIAKLIDWARAEGWEGIHGAAIQRIGPLMVWSGELSVDTYEKLGFKVSATFRISPGLKEGAQSQRRGDHGEAVKKMWEEYAHLTDDEAAKRYDAVLRLN